MKPDFKIKSINKLYGFNLLFSNLSILIKKNQIPKCLLLSGEKGQGKFTLVHHVLASYFDEKNYDNEQKILKENNLIYQIKSNNCENIVYYSGLNNLKIDQIRDLRHQLQKSTLNNKKRFIIFDDIEQININCSNALLKSIEEPNVFNYFILIYNKKAPIIETIKSRSIEIKCFFKKNIYDEIILNLIKDRELKTFLDHRNHSLTPGNFVLFNEICSEENINVDGKLVDNLLKLLKLFKNTKKTKYLDFSIFLSCHYFHKLSKLDTFDLNIIEKRSYVINKINDFKRFNLNLNNLFLDIKNYIT